jgi:hypothetical protein
LEKCQQFQMYKIQVMLSCAEYSTSHAVMCWIQYMSCCHVLNTVLATVSIKEGLLEYSYSIVFHQFFRSWYNSALSQHHKTMQCITPSIVCENWTQ